MPVDKPIKSYQPNKFKQCDKCRNIVYISSVRTCPHPSVNKVYGSGSPVTICIYCCTKCKYSVRDELPGLGCSYEG